MQRDQDSQVDTWHDNIKSAEYCGPYIEVSSRSASHTRHEAVKTKPTDKYG